MPFGLDTIYNFFPTSSPRLFQCTVPPLHHFLALTNARRSQTEEENNVTVVALESSSAFYLELEDLFISLFTVALQFIIMKTCALQSLGSDTRYVLKVLAALTVQMQIKREERDSKRPANTGRHWP
jgi:hypothetical protein